MRREKTKKNTMVTMGNLAPDDRDAKRKTCVCLSLNNLKVYFNSYCSNPPCMDIPNINIVKGVLETD